MPGLDLVLELMDLALQLTQVGRKARDQRPQGVGQLILGVFQDAWDVFRDVAQGLGGSRARTPRATRGSVGLRGARLDESRPGPVDCQDSLLFLGLGRSEAHAGTRDGLTDRLGVGVVALVALAIPNPAPSCALFPKTSRAVRLTPDCVEAGRLRAFPFRE